MKTQKKTHSSLKDELQGAKQETFVQSRYRDRELDGLNARHHRLESVEIFDHQQEIEMLEKQIALEKKVHEQLASFLRKRSSAKQEDALNWGQRYETDTQVRTEKR
jgi:IQ domain-containing protein G